MIPAADLLPPPASTGAASRTVASTHRHPSREPLVWLVIGIPALTVVAGLFTLWIAFQRADSNVTEDYYKEGLAINRKIERDELARSYGLSGHLALRPTAGDVSTPGRLAIELDLNGSPQAFEPRVTLRMTHPVRQSLDRQVVLEGIGGGRYRGQIADGGPAGTRWILAIDTAAWRVPLAGLNQLGAGVRIIVGAAAPLTRP